MGIKKVFQKIGGGIKKGVKKVGGAIKKINPVLKKITPLTMLIPKVGPAVHKGLNVTTKIIDTLGAKSQ